MTKILIFSAPVALAIVFVALLVETPKLALEPVSSGANTSAASAQIKEPSVDGALKPKEQKPYPKLQARNIFSADGLYSQAAEQKPLNVASLTLLGVIGGQTKKAIFREPSGAILSVGEGEPFLNGAVVSRIDRLAVTVNRGAESREFVIFDMKSSLRRGG